MSTNNIRLILKFEMFKKEYEVYFSKNLSFKENMALLMNILELKYEDNWLIFDIESAKRLALDIPIKKMNLIDGMRLYLYYFTNK